MNEYNSAEELSESFLLSNRLHENLTGELRHRFDIDS